MPEDSVSDEELIRVMQGAFGELDRDERCVLLREAEDEYIFLVGELATEHHLNELNDDVDEEVNEGYFRLLEEVENIRNRIERLEEANNEERSARLREADDDYFRLLSEELKAARSQVERLEAVSVSASGLEPEPIQDYGRGAADVALDIGAVFKRAVLLLGTLAIVLLGGITLLAGYVVAGLLLIFVAAPIWFVVADIVTGLIVLPIVGFVAIFTRLKARLLSRG